jgi:hypothetical protein
MSAPVRLAWLAFPLALLTAAAASAPFSHKQHVGAEEVPCKTCHDLKAPGTPALKPQACGKCHEDGPPAYPGPFAKKLSQVKSPHAAHAAKAECSDCHSDVLNDAHPSDAPLVSQARCASCHEEKHASVPTLACARCHGVDLKRERPATHDGTWSKGHGEAAKWRVYQEHGRTCTDCHRPSTCTACHSQVEPRDHTGLWRVRTHGPAAEWDRDRCLTCHQSGMCLRCHTKTPPLSHTGSWRQTHGLTAQSAPNATCNVCHQAAWCAACHSGR